MDVANNFNHLIARETLLTLYEGLDLSIEFDKFEKLYHNATKNLLFFKM